MLVGMVLGRFFRVVSGVKPVSMGDMRMVRRLVMIAGFVMLGGFKVMSSRVLVVFRCLLMVFRAWVSRHQIASFVGVSAEPPRGNS